MDAVKPDRVQARVEEKNLKPRPGGWIAVEDSRDIFANMR
jgi:hypothetical protein